MTRQKIDADLIERVAKGTATATECDHLEKAAAIDPVLREQLALYRALPEAVRPPQLDEADWMRLERRVMAAWESESPRTPVRVPAWAFSAFYGALALVLVIMGAMLVNRTDLPTESDTAFKLTAPPQPFDTGFPGPRGLTAAVTIDERKGNPYVGIHSLARGWVQGGDEIVTAADEQVTLSLGKRATFTLKAESALRFHEYKGRVSPYLAYGEIDCRIQHDPSRPFILLTPEARLIDIGTEFTVVVDPENDTHRVSVREGAVRVERRGATAEVHPGEEADWSSKRRGVRVRAVPPPTKPEVRPPQVSGIPDRPEREPAKQPRIEPAPAKPQVPQPRMDEPAQVQVTRTSWQRTLEALPTPVRGRIVRFYDTVERQMGSGYTQRAILNLENFLDRQRGPEREKAEFLLSECHYQLQAYAKAQAAFLHYIQTYPDGTWSEMARFRFAELSRKTR